METIIRALWLSTIGLLALSLPAPSLAQPLDDLARTLRTKPSPAAKAALTQYAKTHAKEPNGALAALALAVHEIEAKTPGRAVTLLRGLDKRLPQLRDYIEMFLAQALAGGQEFAEAAKVAGRVAVGPVLTRAMRIQKESLIELDRAAEAVRALEARREALDAPAGDLLLAEAMEASGNTGGAIALYKRIYVRDARSPEAADAGTAMARLQVALEPAERMARGQSLLDGGDGAGAQVQFQAAIPDLSGIDRNTARVRLGAARFAAREYRLALATLRELQVASPELDAERLHYAVVAARKARETAAMEALAREFFSRHRESKWRAQALASVAESFITSEHLDQAIPYLRACAEGTAADSPALAFCRWRLAFLAYRDRTPGAFDEMRQFVERHSASPHASAALYYLGRMAERQKNPVVAKGAYLRIDATYPGHFYAMLARERLRDPALASVAAQAGFPEVPFPPTPAAAFDPDPDSKRRAERARMLAAAGLDDFAEREIRHYRNQGGPAHLAAFALAEIAARRGEPNRAVRWIKSIYPAYLNTPLPSAPPAFWRLAFPLPYREDIEKFARAQSLEPALIAGLIRQESEFNPGAVSRVKAQGLMQVMPATGRELSRKLGIKPYSTARLLDPQVSLRMGTYHFKTWLDSLDGQIEVTLAAYNAGKTRAVRWLAWGGYREPAEFIEMIPFNETREYVQAVLRNADTYRRLYAKPPAPLLSGDAANGSF